MSRTLAGFVLLAATPALACLWDTDTLATERAAVPGVLELIVGKFPRHSDLFLEWRAADRGEKINRHDSGEAPLTDERLAAAHDDRAVALERLGRHDAAIAVIREKAARLPGVGTYETAANLGTFLVHAGRFEEGLEQIERALELNPDAHFGREKWQKRLVEYVIERREAAGGENVPLPLDTGRRPRPGRWDSPAFEGKPAGGFAAFVVREELGPQYLKGPDRDALDPVPDEELPPADAPAERQRVIEEALDGVRGMMRFGDFRSPVLLEALGDLLTARGTDHDDSAARLAARAYLMASRQVSDDAARAAYRDLAGRALVLQHVAPHELSDGDCPDCPPELTVAQVEEHLDRELKETAVWFDKVAEDEELWVRAADDPDAKFRAKYGVARLAVGDLTGKPDRLAGHFAERGLPWPAALAIGTGGLLTAWLVVGLIRRRARRPNGWTDAAE